MAVTYTSYRVGAGEWRIAWTSDLGSPPTDLYRIYQNGALVASDVFVEEWVVYVQAGESLVFEVLDDADLEPSTAFPGRLTIGWRRVASATASYRVEEYVGGEWVERYTVADDGSEWFNWESRYLEDVTTHQFRVVPVGENGNDGTPIAFATLMVRHPDSPITDDNVDDKFSYDSGTNKVTIAA